jgi:hypothetical protein
MSQLLIGIYIGGAVEMVGLAYVVLGMQKPQWKPGKRLAVSLLMGLLWWAAVAWVLRPFIFPKSADQ